MKKTLADAIKGMQVKSWEVREHSNGRRVVYVRFEERRPALTVNVKERRRDRRAPPQGCGVSAKTKSGSAIFEIGSAKSGIGTDAGKQTGNTNRKEAIIWPS